MLYPDAAHIFNGLAGILLVAVYEEDNITDKTGNGPDKSGIGPDKSGNGPQKE